MWTIPFLIITELLISVGIILAVKLTHEEVELIYTSYLLLINIVFLVAFFKKIVSFGVDQRLKLTGLIKEQDESSKLLIKRDLELMKANDKLRMIDNQKSEFISIIAHQMRTPLSAMKWMLLMLLKKELGPLNLDQEEFLRRGEESNNHLISLVEGMLLADKLDNGRNDLMKVAVNIGELIDDVTYEVKPAADLKKINLHYAGCSGDICNTFADKEKIRGVIQNLLENAVKYTPDNGSITIQVYEEHNNVNVSVRDTGIGIPKDQQAYIFSKFYRARNASKEVANGSGLGLFIVKSIIEKHGGTVGFESEEGKGSVFTFSLPKSG